MKNVAASVRTRLLNLSRSSGQPLDSLMELYVTGRLLFRLAESEYRERFVLKGAQLFRLWGAEQHRPTRDLDLLGYGDPSEEAIGSIFAGLIAMTIDPPDGLEWGEIKTGPIRDDMDYGGVRLVVSAHLAGARIALQIDVGFGDAITPEATEAEWRELLDFPVARLLAYPPETVIAEKLQAAVSLGLQNSRMKDFFDLLWLSDHQSFRGEILRTAIEETFARRETAVPTEASLPLALTDVFGEDSGKNIQWNAFRRKSRLKAPDLPEVILRLRHFLSPVLQEGTDPGIWCPDDSGWTDFSNP